MLALALALALTLAIAGGGFGTRAIAAVPCEGEGDRAPALTLTAAMQNSMSASGHLEVLHDPQERLTFEDVVAIAAAAPPTPGMTEEFRFERNCQTVPNLGFMQGAVWVRLPLARSADDQERWQLLLGDARIGFLDAYLPTATGAYRQINTGRMRPFATREIAHRTFLFRLDLPPGGRQDVFFRLSGPSALTFPIQFWRLDAFAIAATQDYGFRALLLGILLSITVYNLFVFISLRDRGYLFYALSSLGYLINRSSFDGLGHQFLWFAGADTYGIVLGIIVSSGGYILFAEEFFDRRDRWLHAIGWGLKGLLLLNVALIPFNLQGAHQLVTLLVSPFNSWIVVGSALSAWRGYRPARVLFVASLLPNLVSFIAVAGIFGITPFGWLVAQGPFVTVVVMTWLLSFALAERIRQIDLDRLEAERQALAMTRANEQLILEQNRVLEAKVAERTQALEQTQESLREARDRAEAANRAKSEFLANMSHELRSPLNAILGFVRLLEASPTMAEPHRADLRIVDRSGERLLASINRVLDLSKIEAGRLTLSRRPFDLRQLLRETADLFSLLAREKGLMLRLDCDESVPAWVMGDDLRLQQVLTNLLSNGVKFTERGEVALTVRAIAPERAEAAPESPTVLQFTVRDTGIGIDPTERDRLFEPFLQTRSGERSRQGTGLGLSIARSFVQLMGGDLTVDSQPGQGSRFQFTVPLEAAAPPSNRPEAQLRSVALRPGQRTYRILVADDDGDNRRLLVRLLQPLGFEVTEAADGLEAVDRCDRQGQDPPFDPPFDLIFMDMRMPRLDGLTATITIKQRLGDRAPKIIAFTASAFDQERSRILAAGCDDFIRKPGREAVILQAIERLLGVEFEMGPEATEPSSQADLAPPQVIQRLALLPPAVLNALGAALLEGNPAAIHPAIAAIAPLDPPLADQLIRQAEQLEYAQLMEQVEQAQVCSPPAAAAAAVPTPAMAPPPDGP
jgi:signal transduction histidine kinase/DNA-binding NarL/FixJ family response regulator